MKVADFIGHFNFEWHSQNEVANFGIFVLWKDGEKTQVTNSILKFTLIHGSGIHLGKTPLKPSEVLLLIPLKFELFFNLKFYKVKDDVSPLVYS